MVARTGRCPGMHRQGRYAQRSGAGRLQAQEGQQVRPADQLKAIEMLLDRGFGRSPQQLDIAHSVSDRPLKHLSDETLRLLVESTEQLKEGSGVVIDEDGQVITESLE